MLTVYNLFFEYVYGNSNRLGTCITTIYVLGLAEPDMPVLDKIMVCINETYAKCEYKNICLSLLEMAKGNFEAGINGFTDNLNWNIKSDSLQQPMIYANRLFLLWCRM